MKVLVVDDNFVNRKILVKFLEGKGETEKLWVHLC